MPTSAGFGAIPRHRARRRTGTPWSHSPRDR